MDYTTPPEDVYYPNTMTIYRCKFDSRDEYLSAYHDCCDHYGYKRQVYGGCVFFTFKNDYETWKGQR